MFDRSAFGAGLHGAALTCLLALSSSGAAGADPESPEDKASKDRGFNYGYGLNVNVGDRQASFWNRALRKVYRPYRSPFDTEAEIRSAPASARAAPLAAAVAPGNAQATGSFGPLLPWPIIPVHVALLPDGRVMSYGSDQMGNQSGLLFYDLWDPRAPYPTSHTVLPNTTGTDLFCASLGLLPNGSLLLTGGDLTVQGVRNYSRADVNVFTPSSNTLTRIGTMAYARWYSSDVPLPNGDHLIIGGRSSKNPVVAVQTPEYYSFGQNMFTTLSGATMPPGYYWVYPRTYVMSDGAPMFFALTGGIARLSLSGQGGFTVLQQKAAPSRADEPAVMNGPGRMFSIRAFVSSDVSSATYTFQSVDASGPAPLVATLPSPPGAGRLWSSLTTLADGKIFLNGGSLTPNVMTLVSYQSQIYDPNAQTWTPGPINATPRLYHSVALLLPDATVLTGGGGAPGPFRELNGEIYYPPYLYNADGSLATRPVIVAAPSTVSAGTNFGLAMADATPISAVNLIRMSAVTHSMNTQGRFLPAAFQQIGNQLSVTAPANFNDFLTGYWMVFALDAKGVPSVAASFYVPPTGLALH